MFQSALAWLVGVGVVLGIGTVADARDPIKSDEFFRLRSSVAVRTSGVLLEATAVRAKEDAKGDTIEIDWELDYTGRRPPLVILEPSLSRATAEQTVAVFYALGKNGKVHEVEMKSPHPVGFGFSTPAEWFATVEKGKTATGTLTLSARDAGARFKRLWPDQFDDTAPEVRVQLMHNPKDRGGDLDAWTGTLHSVVREVPLKKW